jgi:purine-cytosine permease-like protein
MYVFIILPMYCLIICVEYFDLENHAGFSQGDIYHHENLVKVIKQVNIVISAVGSQQIADQVKIIAAIKEAGNIKASHRAKQL